MEPEEEAVAIFGTALLTLSELIERHALAVSVDGDGLVTAMFDDETYASAKFEPKNSSLTITLTKRDGIKYSPSISDPVGIKSAWAPVRRAISNWMDKISP